MSVKVALVSLGCSKNQVDAEIMLAKLKKEGYIIENEPSHANVVIVNTCGFIEAAKRESIENILELAALKNDKISPIKGIVVTGCLAQRYKTEVLNELPEVDAIVGIASRDKIDEAVSAVVSKSKEKFADFAPVEQYKPSGDRLLSTPFYTAYLKIADGCDNKCSFCAIPGIRGRYVSRPMEEIVAEAKSLAASGVFEINIIAQDTTNYGIDLYKKRMLPALLEELAKIEGLKWIRILYAYPDGITDELISVMKKYDNIINYIDLPLQHASDRLLRAMRRRSNDREIRALIKKIRKELPDAVLRTTFITGFPGETEEDFEILIDFVREAEFDRVGVFTYSPEEGTAAAEMEQTVDEDTKQQRKEIIEITAGEIAGEKNSEQLETLVEVVVEGYDRYAECYFGRSKYFAPEVDGQIFFSSTRRLSEGEMVSVNITQVIEYDLYGEVVAE